MSLFWIVFYAIVLLVAVCDSVANRRGWFWFYMIAASLAVWSFVVAPANNWWFPRPGIPLSEFGKKIDDLFYMILLITGLTFVGTHIALGYVLWNFGNAKKERSTFTHGSHTLEVMWTAIPAGVLLFISLYQLDVWYRYRVQSGFDKKAMLAPVAEVTARQFEWRIRYPNPTRVFLNEKEVERWLSKPEPDDLYTVNDLHFPSGRKVVIRLRSEDVLHSFFIPHLRVKQDAVPGLVIPVWFETTRAGVYELVCAELCGWGHYKMRGQLTAESEEDFKKYLKSLEKTQFDDGVSNRPTEQVAQNN